MPAWPERGYFFVADQAPLLPPLVVPEIELPFTRPVYLVLSTLKVISSPRSRPPVIGVEPSVPSTIWNVCFSVSAFCSGLPRALHLRRHDPQMRRAPARAVAADRLALIRLPVFHREGVRDDARARLHLENRRAQPHVDRGQQEHRDDLRLREVGLEEIGLHEVRLAGDAGGRGVPLRQLDHVRVVFDALRTEPALGRGDDRAAVARAEVHQVVLRGDLGEVEHLFDQRLRRRHPDDVLARLPDGGLERLRLRSLRVRGNPGHRHERGDNEQTSRATCIHDGSPGGMTVLQSAQ